MTRISENIILIDNLWIIFVPLMLGIYGLSSLLVGIFRLNKISLIVSGICFLSIFIFLTACYFFNPPLPK